MRLVSCVVLCSRLESSFVVSFFLFVQHVEGVPRTAAFLTASSCASRSATTA